MFDGAIVRLAVITQHMEACVVAWTSVSTVVQIFKIRFGLLVYERTVLRPTETRNTPFLAY